MFPPALVDALYAANMAEQRRRDAAAEHACRVDQPHHPMHRQVKAPRWRRWLSLPSDAPSHRITGRPIYPLSRHGDGIRR